MLRAPTTLAFLVAAATAQAAPRFFVFTWTADPATTICVNFQSLGERPLPATVHWDTESRGGVADHRFRAEGTRFRIEGLADRWFYRVPITGLTPGATIHLVAGDARLGISRELSVRTIADDGRTLRFVTGGDMGPGADTRTLLRQAARQEPDFALLGGDIAYANGDLASVDRWDTWLSYWTEEMVTRDGRAIPVALAIGNHEVRGGYGQPRTHAPFFFALFAQDDRSYCVRRFGPHLAAWLLDSGHVEAHGPEQAAWLDRTMAELATVPHKIAVYHVPLYPSHRVFAGSGSIEGRQHWAPVFDRRGLDIAFENHDHTWKRSVPLRAGAPHPDGVVYLGDGCFGQIPRAVNYGGRWYVRQQGSAQHFWCVDVDREGLRCRAIGMRGEVFDAYPEPSGDAAAAMAAARAAQRTKLQPPEGSVVVDALRTGAEPWQIAETRLVFTNHCGAPCQLAIDLDGPEGAKVTSEPPAYAAGTANERIAAGATITVPLRLELAAASGRAGQAFRVRVRCTAFAADGAVAMEQVHTVRAAAR